MAQMRPSLVASCAFLACAAQQGPAPAPTCTSGTGGGWVAIEAPTTQCAYTADSAVVPLAGTAFVSPSWWHCCPPDPAVVVTWVNDATGSSGTASSWVETDALGYVWTHRWSADVSLRSGVNVITVTAADPSGRTGTATLTVTCVVAG